jgi:hypothetical protein
MISTYVQTLQIPIDAQKDGNWIKGKEFNLFIADNQRNFLALKH